MKKHGDTLAKQDQQPTQEQQAVIDRFAQSRADQLRAPRVTAKSKPHEPIAIDHPTMSDALGTMLALGTTEQDVASLLLGHLMNAACDGSPSKPPSEQDINRALAAVHGIGAT